jgi:hypothetical protein
VPGKEERTGVHRNGESTVRQCKQRRAAAFIGGEGALVVTGGGDEVLQLERGKGVMDLQEILGIGWCSAGIREGEGTAGGRRQRSGCEERWGNSSTLRGVGEE